MRVFFTNKKSDFIKNLITAFLAQGISLLCSVLMSFILPKYIGVGEYSYWQLFIFYASYVGFFHFGFNDGIYLRLGGKKYEELDYDKIGTQLKLFTAMELFVSFMLIVVTYFTTSNPQRKFIWIMTGIYLLFANLASCLGFLFQAVNKTKIFSISIIIDRVLVLIFIALLLIEKQDAFPPFVITYTISKIASLVYCAWMGRRIVFSKFRNIGESLAEMWLNLSTGIKLTIANIMSMLILGIGRIIIDNVWGIKAFGKVSLSLSLTNFFLLFIQQVSMVLFPALRRTEEGQQKKIYHKLRAYLSLFLPTAFIAYFPMKSIVGWWLPQYNESLKYFALLLPLCTFDGKMQMLCNTYLKVLRQEKKLLQFNLYAFLMSLCLGVCSGYIFHNMDCVVLSMVLSTVFRSIIAELFLAKQMEINILRPMSLEITFALVFIASTWFLDGLLTFGIMAGAYGIYLFLYKNMISTTSFEHIGN